MGSSSCRVAEFLLIFIHEAISKSSCGKHFTAPTPFIVSHNKSFISRSNDTRHYLADCIDRVDDAQRFTAGKLRNTGGPLW